MVKKAVICFKISLKWRIVTKTTNKVTEKYCYNIKNQLKEVSKEEGKNSNVDLKQSKIWSFTYDEQGNTIKEEDSTETNIYEYKLNSYLEGEVPLTEG